MANALYRKLPSGDWMNQANPGGPVYFQIRQYAGDGLYYAWLTWDMENWVRFTGNSDATASGMQTKLDNYVGQLNAGTA